MQLIQKNTKYGKKNIRNKIQTEHLTPGGKKTSKKFHSNNNLNKYSQTH